MSGSTPIIAAEKDMDAIRLQKFLAMAGICSRRKAEGHILAGRVTVNGKVVDRLGTRVDPETDQVCFDNRPVRLEQDHVYLIVNKPRGYITGCSHRCDPVITELVDLDRRVYPVGRLDKESTGLVLLTNDGRLAHRLAHPSFDHEKEYVVQVAYPICDRDLERLAAGLVIQGRRTRPADVRRVSGRRFRIVLKEGRNRQIRRMVRKVGNRVVALKRIRIDGISLGNLQQGCWRRLKPSEVRRLLAALHRG